MQKAPKDCWLWGASEFRIELTVWLNDLSVTKSVWFQPSLRVGQHIDQLIVVTLYWFSGLSLRALRSSFFSR
jgi:hypothetical protein